MNDLFRRKLDMLGRSHDFGATVRSLFAAASRTVLLLDQLDADIAHLQALSSTEASVTSSAHGITTSRALARKAVMDRLEAIRVSAKSLDVRIPGLKHKFRLRRNLSDQHLLATARAFVQNATPMKAEFIALEMPPTFLEDLEADIAVLEAVISEKHTTRNSKSAATTTMESVVNHGVSVVHELHGIMENKFRNDQGMLVAWRRASRIERPHRAPAKSKEPGAGSPEPKGQDGGLKPAQKAGGLSDSRAGSQEVKT